LLKPTKIDPSNSKPLTQSHHVSHNVIGCKACLIYEECLVDLPLNLT